MYIFYRGAVERPEMVMGVDWAEESVHTVPLPTQLVILRISEVTIPPSYWSLICPLIGHSPHVQHEIESVSVVLLIRAEIFGNAFFDFCENRQELTLSRSEEACAIESPGIRMRARHATSLSRGKYLSNKQDEDDFRLPRSMIRVLKESRERAERAAQRKIESSIQTLIGRTNGHLHFLSSCRSK